MTDVLGSSEPFFYFGGCIKKADLINQKFFKKLVCSWDQRRHNTRLGKIVRAYEEHDFTTNIIKTPIKEVN